MSKDAAGTGLPNNEGPEKVDTGLLNIEPEPDSAEEGMKTAKFE